MNQIETIVSIYIFILGLIIGSFLNVVIYRVPLEISIAKGRSKCTNCGDNIKAYDLIPIVSYIILRGKCRNCNDRISFRYPIIELMTGLLFLSVYLIEGFAIKTILGIAVVAILIAISAIDFEHMIIPNGLIIAMIPVAIAYAIWDKDITVLSRIIGAFAVSLPLFLIILLVPNSFGGGDVKLMLVMGFILGWQDTLLGAFIGVVMGGVVGTVALIKRKRRKELDKGNDGELEVKEDESERDTHIPFGPYLAIGCFIALLFGQEIISWYLSLLM